MDPSTGRLRIFSFIAGHQGSILSVVVDPHETVATYFSLLNGRLLRRELPTNFAAAYSIAHTTQGRGLITTDADHIALINGPNPDVLARYATPAARLDPSRTLKETFGTDFAPCRAHVLIVRRPALTPMSIMAWAAQQLRLQRPKLMTRQEPRRTESTTDSDSDSSESWTAIETASVGSLETVACSPVTNAWPSLTSFATHAWKDKAD